MRRKEAGRRRRHADEGLHPLRTPWGEELDPSHVLEEYPRPQMRRENAAILNGYWDYCIRKEMQTDVRPGRMFSPDGQILVPFSPESLLSGVGRELKPQEKLWYQRRIRIPEPERKGDRCLLHFQAVDQSAEVYVNGSLAVSHSGGYLPFEADITSFVGERECLIQVCVRDESDEGFHARGKQSRERGGLFHTAQSGIWQSVWLEWVPENPIRSVKLTPDFDWRRIEVDIVSERPFEKNPRIGVGEAQIFGTGDVTSETEEILVPVLNRRPEQTDSGYCYSYICEIPKTMPFRPWTPDAPYLYPLTICGGEDVIHSYFAMRIFTVEADEEGIPRFCLNHEPIFVNGVLDQGYWPDGLMTAPSDEALLFDIRLAKKAGFNTIRKHLKIECLRWYYHCDRLGMIVWQDMVNGGSRTHLFLVRTLPTLFPSLRKNLRDNHYRLLSRQEFAGRQEWEEECRQTIELLCNVPSIAVWVPFHEGWGQFDSARICRRISEWDPSRPVDAASGWFDQGAGDFNSVHSDSRRLRAAGTDGRAFVISAYGGLSCRIEGHTGADRVQASRKYETCEELERGVEKLRRNLPALERKGLCGALYTQLSDVEGEVDGLVTCDRRVVKLPLIGKDGENP